MRNSTPKIRIHFQKHFYTEVQCDIEKGQKLFYVTVFKSKHTL